MGCQEGVQGAAKRKQQFLRQLAKGFDSIKDGQGVHSLEVAYRMVEPRELEAVTEEVLKVQDWIFH